MRGLCCRAGRQARLIITINDDKRPDACRSREGEEPQGKTSGISEPWVTRMRPLPKGTARVPGTKRGASRLLNAVGTLPGGTGWRIKVVIPSGLGSSSVHSPPTPRPQRFTSPLPQGGVRNSAGVTDHREWGRLRAVLPHLGLPTKG